MGLRTSLQQEEHARAALNNIVRSMETVMEQQSRQIRDETASMQSMYDAQIQQVRSQQKRLRE